MDGVIAVVDAKRALQELVVDADGGAVSDGAAELSEQIAVADRIILNKVDFVQAKQMANLLKVQPTGIPTVLCPCCGLAVALL